MSTLEKNVLLKTIPLSELKVGEILVNLGELLEIEEQEEYFTLVISRIGEKQVFKFEKDAFVMVLAG